MNRIVTVFSGQGSQYIGMGKQVCQQVPESNKVFEEASDILNMDMKKLCFEGTNAELERTELSQIAIYTVSMAMLAAYEKEVGIRPVAMMGHSLGEYAALTAAGVIRFNDGLKIIQIRGKLMQEVMEQSDYLMCAVMGVDEQIVDEVCKSCHNKLGQVMIANYNSVSQNVISGDKDAVLQASDKLEEMGAKVIQLSLKAPFHTMLMKQASIQFENVLKEYSFSNMNIPVISNTTGMEYDKNVNLPNFLAEHIVKPVVWRKSIELCLKKGVDCFIEIGPKSILTKLGAQDFPTVSFYSYDNIKDRAEIFKEIHSVDAEERALYELIKICIKIAICTPNSNWNEEEYYIGVVEPYRIVKELFYQKKDTTRRANKEEAISAINMLNTVLQTKKIDNVDRLRLLHEVIDKSFFYEQFRNLIVHD